MNKYRAKAVIIDGHRFPSIAEGARYSELKFLVRSKAISDLELQPVFVLQDKFKRAGKTHRAIKYIADFRYKENGATIVEDYKGMKTDVYKIKKKLLLYKYPDINFIETGGRR
jgi:hypothetical protein